MAESGAAGVPPPMSPAMRAKGALRRLAVAQQEPTPENYARAYAEEGGAPIRLLPEAAAAPLLALAEAFVDDGAQREILVAALMGGQWLAVPGIACARAGAASASDSTLSSGRQRCRVFMAIP